MRITAPALDRGQALLIAGRISALSADGFATGSVIPFPRLTGQVANGDLARANFAGDYAEPSPRSESIDGQVLPCARAESA